MKCCEYGPSSLFILCLWSSSYFDICGTYQLAETQCGLPRVRHLGIPWRLSFYSQCTKHFLMLLMFQQNKLGCLSKEISFSLMNKRMSLAPTLLSLVCHVRLSYLSPTWKFWYSRVLWGTSFMGVPLWWITPNLHLFPIISFSLINKRLSLAPTLLSLDCHA
jgi:hypothetical protein